MNASLLRGRRPWLAAAMLMFAALVTILVVPVFAANPAPVQTFYLTEPEDHMLPAMKVINTTARSPMVSKTSIAINADGTLVYYDHWENGFANDIANPTATEIYSNPGSPGGVQIWGNGLAADGCAPMKGSTPVVCTDANDVLNSGDVIILDDESIVVPNSSSSIDWDGKDKIAATQAVAVSRSLWASGSNSLFAWANAMMPTTEWGAEYTAPVGCDTTTNAGTMFNYSAFSITAAYDGTVIEVDPEGDGTWEAQETLNEGETWFDSSSTGLLPCPYIREGGKVRSADPAKPIQVVLITGQIGSSYGSRDLNLVPDSSLSSSYWIPVGNTTGSNVARAFIHNLESTTLYVKCERPGFSSVQTIAPGAVSSTFTLNNDEAGHCFAVTDATGNTPDTSRKFSGLLTIDTAGTASDWALPFIPETGLSNQALVGLGAGRDWTASESPLQNGSPLWVTPVCDTYFYVDWNNDGTPDKVDFNGNNDVLDSNVNGLNEETSDQGFLVTSLKSVRLFDASDRDQTGAYIYTRTGKDNTGDGGCNFAAAWGQDPRTASAGRPGLDMGTIIVALRSVQSSKALNLVIDADTNAVVSPGDTIEYVINISNIGLSSANVSVYDTVPAGTTYVPGTTEVDTGSGWTPIADDGSGTVFPLDDPAPDGVPLGALPPGETWQVRFRVTVDIIAAGPDFQILNCARLAYDNRASNACVATDVVVPPEIAVTKTANPTTIPTTGGDVVYTFVVENTSNIPVNITSLTDSVFGTLAGGPLCQVGTRLENLGDSCQFTATFTLPPGEVDDVHLNVFTAEAEDDAGNPTSDDDPEPVLYFDGTPSIVVTKTAQTLAIPLAGGDVAYTFTVTNDGPVRVTITSLSDDKFGTLAGDADCMVGTPLNPTDSCEFTATFTLPPGAVGSTHDNTFTTEGEDDSGNPVEDDDDATVTYYPTNVCVDTEAENRRTDILGMGMGNPKKHRNIAKVVIPNWTNVVELYGQMAGKEEGAAKYVRFMYPGKNGFVQMGDITAYAPRHSAVFWYGTELDPHPNIRGRWFLQKSGIQKHIPRALVVYPTYETAQKYVNIFEKMEPSDTQVYWDVANGWVARQQVVIDIPAPQVATTFNIKAALVDNDKDARPIFVTMEAGGVSQTLQPIGPDRKDQLNILEFTLANVPAGTSSITLTIESPAPSANQLFPLGGDSGAVIGVTANYFCADVPLP